MRSLRVAVSVLVAGWMLAGSAHAAGLAPKKASDKVVVQCENTTSGRVACQNSATDSAFFVNHDGSTQPFAIPEGKVLILTSAQVEVCGGVSPGSSRKVILSAFLTELALSSYSTVASDGCLVAQFQFANGIVVKSSGLLLAGDVGFNKSQVVLQGFFAKDR